MAFEATQLYERLHELTGEIDWTIAWSREDGYTAYCDRLRLSRQRTFKAAMREWEKEIYEKWQL